MPIDCITITGEGGPLLRVVPSADGFIWQTRLRDPRGPAPGPDGWATVDGPHPDIDVACAALYPAMYGSVSNTKGMRVVVMEASMGGAPCYRAYSPSPDFTLGEAAGFAPWLLVLARQACPE